MHLINSNKNDIDSILKIILEAQTYLAKLNIEQWQDGYPNKEVILNDILKKESYVVKNQYYEIVATTMFTITPEKTYSTINGKWLTNDDAVYGVIHRMAVSKKFRNTGIAKFILKKSENYLIKNNIISMRIDTHPNNKVMQSLLEKNNYKYCGIILLENNDERFAFEKILVHK